MKHGIERAIPVGANTHTHTQVRTQYRHLPLYALDKLFKYTYTHTYICKNVSCFRVLQLPQKIAKVFILLLFRLDLSSAPPL